MKKLYCAQDFYAGVTAQGAALAPYTYVGNDGAGNARVFKAPLEYADIFNTARGNQTTTPAVYRTFNFTVPVADQFKIDLMFQWSLDSTQQDFIADLLLDNNPLPFEFVAEPKDAGGTGVTVEDINGGTFNSGTSQRYTANYTDLVALTAGAHTLELRVSNSQANNAAVIYRSRMFVNRFLGV